MMRLILIFTPILLLSSSCGQDELLSSSKSNATILYDLRHTAIGKHFVSSVPAMQAARQALEYSEDVRLARGLIEFGKRAFAAAMTHDELHIQDRFSGSLEISGNTWVFKEFRPWLAYDNDRWSSRHEIRINGTLEVDEGKIPFVPVTGTLETFNPSATTTFDLVIELTEDGLIPTGTIDFELSRGEEYELDIAAVMILVGLF